MVTKHIEFFDPNKIADSGQAFRIHKIDDSHTETVAYGKYLQIAKTAPNEYTFSCTQEEFENIWEDYFDLKEDYEQIAKTIDQKDRYLKEAAKFSHGIRILKQEPFETLISYIISQRRSIPSITTSVDRLSELNSRQIQVPEEIQTNPIFANPLKQQYFAFPTQEELQKISFDELQSTGVGYRAPYIEQAAKTPFNPNELRKLTDDELFEYLISMHGVGKKVANCVMLFAFHRTGRFPVDVWIERIQNKYYNGHFDADRYPDTAGIMQQFMFYYERRK